MAGKSLKLDVNYIIKEYLSGRSAQNIAEELNVSVQTITNRVKYSGYSIRGNVRNVDDKIIVDLYESGISTNKIGIKLGVNQKVITRVLKKNGIGLRPSAWTRRIFLPVDEVRSMHESGIGIGGIAKHFGVAPSPVVKALEDAGLIKRNRSEQQLARMARTTLDERKKLVAAANKASRGRKVPEDIKCKTAKTRETTLSIVIADVEKEVINMLHERGFDAIPQVAIGPYNCDIAVHPVAVEVFGGGWHFGGEHLARTEERFRYIMNAGWHIVVVVVDRRSPFTTAVADNLVAEINRLRSNPSAVREYRVIWRAGEIAIGGRADDDNFSIEYPLRSTRNLTTGRYEGIPK